MEIPVPYMIAILAGAAGVIAFLYRALITTKDKVIDGLEKENGVLREKLTDTEATIKTFQEVASEALKSVIETTNFYRAKEGKPPLALPVQVVSEGSSPPTLKQRHVALAATYRAAMVVVREETGQEARKEPGA